ncbi:MAG: Fur family transcriptional regulator [Deltaproteobacteria bacterium]|nr:Fur family transcriptional regulator [Deltaproteobacteria bacterium]
MRRTAEEIENLLRRRGFSLTPQRRAILRHLAERGGHWTAAEVLESLTGEFPLASRATVYSTLALLRELGVLADVPAPGPGGEARYDANPEPHQHFVCRRCGCLEDVPSEWFPVAIPAGVGHGFSVEHYRIVAEGVCAGCESSPRD